MRSAYFILCLLFCAAAGCSPSAQSPVSFSAAAQGVTPGSTTVGGWNVTLRQALLGFGPAYFCNNRADNPELCAEPPLEFDSTATLDALNLQVQTVGQVHGVSCEVQSVQFDFAITWLGTQAQPLAGHGAPLGHSAVLRGDAQKDGVVIHFNALVDINPYAQGSRAVQGMPASAHVTASTQQLVLQVDPYAWLAQVDFDAVAAAHSADGGSVLDVDFAAGSNELNAVMFQLTTNARPAFVWVTP